MHCCKLVAATVATVLSFGAIAVAGSASAATGQHEDSAEIAAVLAAKVSAAQAIATAEQQAGGRAAKLDLEKEKGAHLYEIKTIAGDKVLVVFVDTASGKVVRTDEEGLIGRLLDHEDKAQLAALTNSPTTLAAAIATAEQHIGGRAVEGGMEDKNGKVLFQVDVAKETTIHEVMVDPATGQIVPDRHGNAGKHEK